MATSHSHHAVRSKTNGARALLLAAALLASHNAFAIKRIERRYDQTNGLPVATVFIINQDTEGFIWIGTAGGLVRYDGSEMRPWAKDVIKRGFSTLAAGPNGEVLLAEYGGMLYRVTAAGVEPLPGPDGKPVAETRDASFDNAGRLWVVTANRDVYLRDGQQRWQSFDVKNSFPGERVHGVRPGAGDRVYFLTNKGVRRVRVGERPQPVIDVKSPLDVVEHLSGSVFVMAFPLEGEVIEIRPDGSSTVRVKFLTRPMDLVLRGDVVWAAYDRYLVSLRGDEPPDIIGPEDGLPGGGALLVDHEGSLWMGGFSGLFQYPEPETIIWNEKDGLGGPRMLIKTQEGIWASTWGGMGRIAREGNSWRVYDEKVKSLLCVDDQDKLLVHEGDEIKERRDGHFITQARLPFGILHSCTQANDGTLLLATLGGLFRCRTDGGPPEALKGPTSADGKPEGIFRVFQDDSRIWAATSEGRICHAPANDILSGLSPTWSCQMTHPSANIFDFARMPSGSIWMSSSGAGLWRLQGNGWESIPASQTLPSQVMFSLTPSPNGGVWVTGHGTTMRVVERPDTDAGWEVVEALSMWEGLSGSGANDLLEEPDGGLWLSTASGVAHVPAKARWAEAAPPRVRLVELILNGQRAPNTDKVPELANGSQVELRFAALSYRDRGRLRYQYRLRSDAPWIESRDASPVLRFVDLRAGDYQAQVRASLDGVNWTVAPARLSFEVLSPWYLRPVTLVLFGLIIAALLYFAHRTRVAFLMRLARQRAQIARDLHDEMGSGLGSIGILSSLAAQGQLDEERGRDVANKIADTAGELANTLTEIVWTLRPGDTTLEALAYHLSERASRLFPGEETKFAKNFPERWPNMELSLAARRSLLLIASEALHNAARHAQASRVLLGFAPSDEGRRWRMWIADDGRGYHPNGPPQAGSGMGLMNMRRRAEEIGAQISWMNNEGTVVSVIFDPKTKGLDIQ